MRKVGFVVDSGCGLTKEKVEELGGYFVPLLIEANDITYKDGIDLTDSEFEELMYKAKSVKSAANLPIDVFNTWDKALSECETIVHMTLPNKISKTNELVEDLAKMDIYKGKVFVLKDSRLAAPWTSGTLHLLIPLVNSSKSAAQALKNITTVSQANPYGKFVTPNLKFLAKGGRINPIKAFIGNLLKLCPIITYNNGHLPEEEVDRARGFDNAVKKAMLGVKEKYESYKNKTDYHYYFSYEGDLGGMDKFYDMIETNLGVKKEDVLFARIGNAIRVHTGPNLFGIWVVFDNFKKFIW